MTTLCRTGIMTRGSGFNLLSRQLHISACCQKNIRAGTQKITSDRSKQLTYEEAARPYDIGVKKTWNSWNTSNLFEETDRTSETTLEDVMIRKFIAGTWHNMFLSEVIIKRRLNRIIIGGILNQGMVPSKIYFLKGYTEEFLSHYLRRPVRIEIQTARDRSEMIIKRI